MKDRVLHSYPSTVLTARLRAMRASGPLLMLAVLGSFELLRAVVPLALYPVPIMLLVIVYAALSGGLRSGLMAALLGVLYSFRYFSLPGAFLSYGDETLQQLISNLVVMPVLAVLVGMLKHRTDRLASGELRASEDRFEATFEQAAVGIAHVAPDGHFLRVNQRLCDLLGYGRAELMLRRFADLAADGSAVPQLDPLPSAAGDSHEQRLRRKDGGLCWASLTISTVQPAADALSYSIVVVSDISSLKRIEDALRASEHRYRRLFDSNPEAMWVYDRASLRFLEVNDTAVARYGWSRAELGGMTVDAVQSAAEVAEIERSAREQPATTQLSVLAQHRRRDGSSLVVEVVGHAIEFDGRDAILVLATDMTARREAELALAAEKERLSVTLRSIGDGVITTDTAGCVVLLNPAAEALTGWSQTEAAGVAIDEVFPVEDEQSGQRIASPISRVLKQGQPVAPARPLALRNRNGTTRLITDSGAPIRDRDGQLIGAVLVFRDITDQTRLERQLQQAQRMESIGVLAGGIAHDFNNLLTGIIGTADLALLDLDPDNPLWPDLDNIKKQGQRGAALTKQLLAFSRRQQLEPRLVDLNDVVHEVAHFLQRAMGLHTRLEFQPEPELATVYVDPVQIEQVLLNLCINARDAMPEGGRVVLSTANVELDAAQMSPQLDARPGQYVELALADTGHGIARETLQHIFEPFFTTKDIGKGTGLGLAMVYGIVTQHQGLVAVESEVGRGTRFRILLPAASAAPALPSSEPAELPMRGSETILIVEEDPMVRDLMMRALEARGYTVLARPGSMAALELYAARPELDLVVLDLQPPLVDDALYTHLRAVAPRLPLLVTTSYGDADLEGELQAAGVGLLLKPFDPVELVARVRALLDAAARSLSERAAAAAQPPR